MTPDFAVFAFRIGANLTGLLKASFSPLVLAVDEDLPTAVKMLTKVSRYFFDVC